MNSVRRARQKPLPRKIEKEKHAYPLTQRTQKSDGLGRGLPVSERCTLYIRSRGSADLEFLGPHVKVFSVGVNDANRRLGILSKPGLTHRMRLRMGQAAAARRGILYRMCHSGSVGRSSAFAIIQVKALF
jgi:hypothetical protein